MSKSDTGVMTPVSFSSRPTIGGMDPSGADGPVLVVEDEPTIADVVARYLRRAGYETAIAHDGLTALRMAGEQRPALIVLDIMLPGLHGLEVMRRVRERPGERTGIILLTARGEESDRVVGLRAGADDYVVKPFSPAELVARVDAVLRRTRPVQNASGPICFDSLEIDPAGRRVIVRGEEVELTQREFDLLLFFAENPGQVFSRDQLMDRVWQVSFYSDTTTVTVHVRRLRAKIEATAHEPHWIRTVWGVGYRFCP